MTFKVIKERLPIYWGSFLVNNDDSGLEPDEMPTIQKTIHFLEDHYKTKLWCVDMKEDVHFERAPIQMNWLLDGDYATYIFHSEGLKNE